LDKLKKGPNYKLRVNFNKKRNEIEIIGNSDGLKYLSEICQRIIGKTDPSGHWHFSDSFHTLDKDSVDLIIIFEE
jgi:hypothetical protein